MWIRPPVLTIFHIKSAEFQLHPTVKEEAEAIRRGGNGMGMGRPSLPDDSRTAPKRHDGRGSPNIHSWSRGVSGDLAHGMGFDMDREQEGYRPDRAPVLCGG